MLASIGIATGTVASFMLVTLMASLLFGTTARDGGTFLSMILLLLLVSVVAGYIPARRASRIHPMIALRNN
jgi:ABC-type antimicrobial peptide transport system permease subunit